MIPAAVRADASARTDAAVRALAARDLRLPAVGMLLDPDRLAEALGRPVRVTRVRYKPGSSIVVAFADAEGHGWIASYVDDEKVVKTRARADRAGLEVHRVPAIPRSATGPAFADRLLVSTVRRLRRLEPALIDPAAVLRHNPHRRLVLAVAGRVVKVTASTDGERARIAAVRALATAGVPVLAPARLQRGVTVTSRWGRGDLAARPAASAAATAGRALAILHDAPIPPSARSTSPETELDAAVAAVRILSPEAGARAASIARGITLSHGTRVATLHGDFTADQVLVDGDKVRLIDFDRLRIGAPERDLGAFLADERLRRLGPETADDAPTVSDALIDAYRAAGGRVDDLALRQWTAAGVILRAVEPFRQGLPGWASAIDDALGLAAELIA